MRWLNAGITRKHFESNFESIIVAPVNHSTSAEVCRALRVLIKCPPCTRNTYTYTVYAHELCPWHKKGHRVKVSERVRKRTHDYANNVYHSKLCMNRSQSSPSSGFSSICTYSIVWWMLSTVQATWSKLFKSRVAIIECIRRTDDVAA